MAPTLMTSHFFALVYSGFLSLGWRVAPHSHQYAFLYVCVGELKALLNFDMTSCSVF